MSTIWQRIFGGPEASPDTGPGAAAAAVSGPDEVRLESAIPGLLDMDGVVMGTPTPGLYQLHSGEEIHALSALLSFDGGDRIRVGTGSKVDRAGAAWFVTGFTPEQQMVLQRAGTVDLAALEIPEDNPVVFPDAEVRNLWIQKDQAVVTWVADLTSAVREDSSRVGPFVDAVIAAGEAACVLQIHEVAELGFRDVEDGSFGDWLRQRRSREAAPDLLGDMGGLRASAELAFFNKAGRLIESQSSAWTRCSVGRSPTRAHSMGSWRTIRRSSCREPAPRR